MTTRLLIAYAMIAVIAGGALTALWLCAIREPWARRGRRIRHQRDKARAPAARRLQEAAAAE